MGQPRPTLPCPAPRASSKELHPRKCALGATAQTGDNKTVPCVLYTGIYLSSVCICPYYLPPNTYRTAHTWHSPCSRGPSSQQQRKQHQHGLGQVTGHAAARAASYARWRRNWWQVVECAVGKHRQRTWSWGSAGRTRRSEEMASRGRSAGARQERRIAENTTAKVRRFIQAEQLHAQCKTNRC